MEMASESKTVTTVDSVQGTGSVFQAVVDELEAREKDLVLAAELGTQLLRQNEQLKRKNNEIIDHFRQRIFELEEEKISLKQRLTSVESDYDAQIKELQSDVVCLRVDVQKQKNLYRELEGDRSMMLGELSQKNELLSQKLNDAQIEKSRLEKDLATVQLQMEERKNSMHIHLQQLDSLRQEIKELRGQKLQLEKELTVVTEERDQLLSSLSQDNERILLMQNLQDEQLATISHQEKTIVELQNRANTLHVHLQDLSSLPGTNPGSTPITSEPHHSLKAELDEERLKREQKLSLDGPDPVQPGKGFDVDEVEMDDEAMRAFVSSYYGSITGMKCGDFDLPIEGAGDIESSNSLFRSLGLEISEIYQQMQHMCIELCALQNARSTSSNQPGPVDGSQSTTGLGTSTPDELAIVEMEVRLESLRSVLVNLEELLRDLTPSVEEETCQGQESRKQSRGSQTLVFSKTMEHANPTPTDTEAAVMLSQRDALLMDVACTHHQLASVRQEIERMDKLMKSKPADGHVNLHLCIWQELDGDDEKYEFEHPR